MPRRSPFTALCRQLAQLAEPRRADLHVHTTASDGAFTPSQVAARAQHEGLSAVAITDHDTLAGVAEATETANSLSHPGIEVVPGVEITTEFAGRELHLLAYFVRTDHAELTAALDRLCAGRRERFRDYLAKLAARGIVVPQDRAVLVEGASVSLGRPHVAALLVTCGFAKSQQEAFHRFVGSLRHDVMPKEQLPIAEAIRLVHAAGGVTSLAHPPADYGDDEFREMRDLGLDAVEAVYPWGRSSPAARLRAIASRLGLLVSGGSDFHGPAHRRIGSHAVTSEQLERLRQRCG